MAARIGQGDNGKGILEDAQIARAADARETGAEEEVAVFTPVGPHGRDSRVQPIVGFYSDNHLLILRDALLAKHALRIDKRNNQLVSTTVETISTYLLPPFSIAGGVSSLIESICVALLDPKPNQQILVPYRMENKEHWVTLQLLIKKSPIATIDLIVHDSANLYDSDRVGSELGYYFNVDNRKIFNEFLSTNVKMQECAARHANLRSYFFAGEHVSKIIFTNRGRSECPSIQLGDAGNLKNLYCGGYTIRLIINLSLNPSIEKIEKADDRIWGCGDNVDQNLRVEDAKTVNRYLPAKSSEFRNIGTERAYIESREHKECSSKQKESLDKIMKEVENSINLISCPDLQELIETMQKQQSSYSLVEVVNVKRMFVNLYNRHRKLFSKTNWLALFFKGDLREIDESSEVNSNIVLLDAWEQLLRLLQKKTRTEPEADVVASGSPAGAPSSSISAPLRAAIVASKGSPEEEKTQKDNLEAGSRGGAFQFVGDETHPVSELKRGLHGSVYQLKLLMLFLQRGLTASYKCKLATEYAPAGKFDDVLFQYVDGDKIKRRYVQAKHKLDSKNRIELHHLLTEKDDEFSLQKYLASHRKVTKELKTGETIQDFIICTNITFGFKEKSRRNKYGLLEVEEMFEEVGGEDNIFKQGKRYRFKKDFPGKEEILYPILKKASDLQRLGVQLADCLLNKKQLNLKNYFFKKYHRELERTVFDIKTGKLKDKFVSNSTDLDKNTRRLREILVKELRKKGKTIEKLSEQKIGFSANFGKVCKKLDSYDIEEDFTEKFLEWLVLAKKSDKNEVVIEKRLDIVKNNIKKLSGYILVNTLDVEEGGRPKNKIKFSKAFLKGEIGEEREKLPDGVITFRGVLEKKFAEEGFLLENFENFEFKINNFCTCEEGQVGVPLPLPDDDVTDKEIESFMEHLVFAVEQSDEGIDALIETEIGKEFNLLDNDFIVSDLQNKMLDWMAGKEGVFLSDKVGKEFFEHVRGNINQLVLIGPTIEYRTIIEEPNIAFNTSMDLDALFGSHRLLIYVSEMDTRLSSVKVYDAIRKLDAYKADDSYIFVRDSSALRLKERLLSAFSKPRAPRETHLLIIECQNSNLDEKVGELFSELIEILKNQTNKKIIFITKNGGKLKEQLPEGVPSRTVSDGVFNFSELTPESQKHLKDKSVIFQGRKVGLSELITESDFDQVLQKNALLECIRKKNIVLDAPLTNLDIAEEAYVVPRALHRKVSILNTCLKDNISDCFILTGVDSKTLKELIPPTGKLYEGKATLELDVRASEEESKLEMDELKSRKEEKWIRYVLAKDAKEAQEIFEIIRKKQPACAIHFLAYETSDLIWQSSHGTFFGIRSYIKDAPEALVEKPLDEINDRITLIAAEPGMGKSTALTRMAHNLKKNFSHMWIMSIDLKDWENDIDTKSFTTLQNVVDFISEKRNLSALAAKVLEYYLQKEDSFAILLDGFDEISALQQEKILGLIRILSVETKVKHLYVSTRLHMKETLEDATSVLSYSLKPFSESDIKNFLRKFWRHNVVALKNVTINDERLSIYIDALYRHFQDSIRREKEINFMGIPLQARMLAEVFQDKFERFCTSGLESTPSFPTTLHISQLYEQFFQKKHEIYLQDKLKIASSLRGGIRIALVKSFSLAHQRLAFESLFSREQADSLGIQEDNNLTVSDLNDMGIVQILDDGKINFTHPTFAEYFVAEWIFWQLNASFSAQLKNFIVRNIFKKKNQVIRRFLEQKIDSFSNLDLIKKWKGVQECDLLQTTHPRLELVKYTEDELKDFADDKIPEDVEILSFEQLKSEIHLLRVRYDKTKINDFFKKLDRSILKINRIEDIEYLLGILIYTAIYTGFNILKKTILQHFNSVVKQYFKRIFSQETPRKKMIKYDILECLPSIPVWDDFGEYNTQVCMEISYEKRKYLEELKIYREAEKLKDENPEINELFVKNLTGGGILFLSLAKRLNKSQVLWLQDVYPAWKENSRMRDHFLSLFFNINEDTAELVKDFFIENLECDCLFNLLENFDNISLSESDVDKLYNVVVELKKDDQASCWFEKQGVKFYKKTKILTLAMVEKLSRKLQASRDQSQQIYVREICNNFILPTLAWIREENFHGDRFAFIKLFFNFFNFAMDHNLRILLNSKQLITTLGIIQEILNRDILLFEEIKIMFEFLRIIVSSLGFRLINIDMGLLILDPVEAFQFELSLKHKDELMELVRILDKSDIDLQVLYQQISLKIKQKRETEALLCSLAEQAKVLMFSKGGYPGIFRKKIDGLLTLTLETELPHSVTMPLVSASSLGAPTTELSPPAPTPSVLYHNTRKRGGPESSPDNIDPKNRRLH